MLPIQKLKKESGIDDLGTLVYKIARDKLVDCFDFNVSKKIYFREECINTGVIFLLIVPRSHLLSYIVMYVGKWVPNLYVLPIFIGRFHSLHMDLCLILFINRTVYSKLAYVLGKDSGNVEVMCLVKETNIPQHL